MWNNEELVAQAFVEQYLKEECFPLELERIALAVEQKLGIKVFLERVSFPYEVNAHLRVAKHAALIWVNKNHSIVRQRFSAAHEFGHIIMKHRNGIPNPGNNESEQEYESANNFAAALLMPAWDVACLVKKYPDSLIFLASKTAHHFGVSMEAAARRLATTEVIPGLFTLIDPNVYRTEWEYHSPSIHLDHDAFHYFLARQIKLPLKRREEDLDIMGYPFRVECRRVWDKLLVTCLPFTMMHAVAETAAGYGR
jgi:Predicted Zn peptidase